jgi:hypothetical protein
MAAIAALAVTAACGGGGDEPDGGPVATRSDGAAGAQPTALPANTPAPSAGGGSGRNASIQLSGAVNGTLSVQGMTCGPGTMVSISGTIGSAQYTFEASAASAGTIQLNSNAGGGVRLVETAPGFRSWAVGALIADGSGSLTIDARSGQVSAEAGILQGTGATVRIQGNWTCP